MKDKLLLWPLLFDGQLHCVGQDPVVDRCSGVRDIPTGCGWWGNRQGRGYGANESDLRWFYALWERTT